MARWWSRHVILLASILEAQVAYFSGIRRKSKNGGRSRTLSSLKVKKMTITPTKKWVFVVSQKFIQRGAMMEKIANLTARELDMCQKKRAVICAAGKIESGEQQSSANKGCLKFSPFRWYSRTIFTFDDKRVSIRNSLISWTSLLYDIFDAEHRHKRPTQNLVVFCSLWRM